MKVFNDIKKLIAESQDHIDIDLIKNKMIKRFKEEKVSVTNILQDELKELVKVLNKEIVNLVKKFL
jgi:hypothetical protein